MKLLYKLRDKGNTILVIEHALEVIAASDYIVDLGHLEARMVVVLWLQVR